MEKSNSKALSILEKPVTFLTDTGEITLSVNQVKRFVVRGDPNKVTLSEAVNFVQLCRFNALNPFVGDAYLIKFGDDCQMVTSKSAYLKRADSAESFDGFRAGVILFRENYLDVYDKTGEMPDRVYAEGSLVYPGFILLGGWAEVHNGKKFPVRAEVSLTEYEGKTREGKVTKMWRTKPATMIRKVALVGGLREAFPSRYNGLYSEDELPDAEGIEPKIVPVDDLSGGTIDVDVTTGEIVDDTKGALPQCSKCKANPVAIAGEDLCVDCKREATTGPSSGNKKSGFRSRRNKTELNGKEIVTCGATAVQLTSIYNASSKSPEVSRLIDDFLRGKEIKDPTFLRQDEATELIDMILGMAPGFADPPGAGNGSGEDSNGNGSVEGGTSNQEGTRSSGSLIPCPDRADCEIELSFCEQNCPKYSNRTCANFSA